MQTFETQKHRSDLLVQLTQLAVAAPNVPSAITPILNTLVSRTAAVGAAYFQTNGMAFHARAASGEMPEGPIMEHILLHGLPNETPLMRALEVTTFPLFFDDTTAALETAGFPDLGVHSMAAAPVCTASGELLGAFLMHTFVQHDWTDGEADLFAAVAGVLASLTARLVAEEKAVAAHEDALRALGLALEHRDGETKGHTDRVTSLALRIGTEMGFDEEDLKALRWGSYLHDIGKISTPDAILRKPGKLDTMEWEIMRAHSPVGHSFASQLRFLPEAVLDVILYHHERWAGGGYPRGLERVDIPLAARIFSVCDVYDALTSTRPYKHAWTHEEAVAEIRAQSGNQFDPTVVAAFLQVEPSLRANNDLFAEAPLEELADVLVAV